MWRLIQSECYKLIKSDYYRRFIVIYLFVAIAALSQDRETKMGFLLTGYEWFCVRQMMIGWAGIPLPFFVAEYMAAEFTNHGFESALMCGFTRKELFRAKIMVCLMGLLVLTLINTIAGTIITTVLNGFGATLNGMTIVFMVKRFTYYIFAFIITNGVMSFIFAVMTKSKIAVIVLDLVVVELMGSTTGRIWYILKDMKNPVWKEIVHRVFEFTPLYQLDSLLIPEHFRPHQFWQFLLSCSVCLLVVYLLTINLFKRSDMQ